MRAPKMGGGDRDKRPAPLTFTLPLIHKWNNLLAKFCQSKNSWASAIRPSAILVYNFISSINYVTKNPEEKRNHKRSQIRKKVEEKINHEQSQIHEM